MDTDAECEISSSVWPRVIRCCCRIVDFSMLSLAKRREHEYDLADKLEAIPTESRGSWALARTLAKIDTVNARATLLAELFAEFGVVLEPHTYRHWFPVEADEPSTVTPLPLHTSIDDFVEWFETIVEEEG